MAFLIGTLLALIIPLTYLLIKNIIDSIDRSRINRIRKQNNIPYSTVEITQLKHSNSNAIKPSVNNSITDKYHSNNISLISKIIIRKEVLAPITKEEEPSIFFGSPNFPEIRAVRGTCDTYAESTLKMSSIVKSRLISDINTSTKSTTFIRCLKCFTLKTQDLDNALHKARNQEFAQNAYEALSLIIPHHFDVYFGIETGSLSNWHGSGTDFIKRMRNTRDLIQINRDKNRSHIARTIVVCNLDWKEVMNATKYMELNSMIFQYKKDDISNELDKIRWCAKYWFRALAFGEDVRFNADYRHITIGSSVGLIEVPDEKVPQKLRWCGKY